MAKIDITPVDFENGSTDQNHMTKHCFWTCWIQKTCREVSVWVVGWGAPLGGGKGVKLTKIQALMEVVEKNDGNQ